MQVQEQTAETPAIKWSVFVQPPGKNTNGQPSVINAVVLNAENVQVGEFSRETIEEISKRYPGVYIADLDEVMQQKRDLYRAQFDEIGAESFQSALECLPPVGWRRSPGFESFKMSERLFDNITAIYCRLRGPSGDRYFRFNDYIGMSDAAVFERVKREMPAEVEKVAA